jgi:hypothetical protein
MTATSCRVAARAFAITLGTVTAAPAFAQAGGIDGADTAWMMVATAIADALLCLLTAVAIFAADHR